MNKARSVLHKIEQKFDATAVTLWEKVMDPSFSKRLGIALMLFGGMVLTAKVVSAITAPASGSFAYTVYDVAINRMLNGPIGFVAGVGSMALGAIMAVQQKVMLAIPCILGGAVLLNADDLVTSLGMTF